MSAPSGESPTGSLATGAFAAWQATTEEDAKNQAKAGVIGSFGTAQSNAHATYNEPIAQNTSVSQNNGVVIREVANSVEQKVWKPDIPLVQPYWVSPSPFDDVSFAYMMLALPPGTINVVATGAGSTGSTIAAGDMHSHSMGNVNVVTKTFTPSASFTTPAKDVIVGGVIHCPYNRTHDLLSFVVGTVSSPCPIYVQFYKMDDDGDFQLIHASSALTISTQQHMAQVTIPEVALQAVLQGDTVAVGIRQSGSGNVRALAGLTMPEIAAPGLVHPPSSGWTYATGSSPSTITKAQQNYSTTFTPWVAAGHSVTVPPAPFLVIQDAFDRPNGALGQGWFGNPQQIRIHNGAAIWDAGITGSGWVLFPTKLNYDDVAVEANIGIVDDSGMASSLIARSSNDLSTRVACNFTHQSTNVSINGTVVESNSVGWAQGNKIRFECIGNTYKVFKNGAQVLSVTNGSASVGFLNRYAGFAQAANFFSGWPPELNTWLAEDIH